MKVTKRLSVAAVIAALALLGAALFGGVADAKKKKGGKLVRISAKQKPIPDATQTCVDTSVPPDGTVDCTGNGGQVKNGILVNSARIGNKLDGTKLKDVNIQLTITHSEPGDLTVLVQGPNGKIISPYGFGGGVFENLPPTFVLPPTFHFFTLQGKLGPTTFDDQATQFVNDTNSCPNLATEPAPGACTPPEPDGGGVESFSPYAGIFKPADGTLGSLGKKLKAGQAFNLIVFDNDPANECSTPGCSTGGPMDTQADPADTGSASMTVIGKPKGGGGKGK